MRVLHLFATRDAKTWRRICVAFQVHVFENTYIMQPKDGNDGTATRIAGPVSVFTEI